MLNSNHPDDERLSALASHEADATADATLTAHVSSCDRCTGLVNELGALRAALGELPDVAPSRPLRLLPTVEPAPPAAVDRLGGWARRFFAPVLASGAALALAGTIGTAAPAFQGQSASGGAVVTDAGASAARILGEPAPAASEGTEEFAAGEDAAAGVGEAANSEPAAAAAAPSEGASRSSLEGEGALATPELSAPSSADSGVGTLGLEDGGESAAPDQAPADRSPWPMVLFSGVALMVAAVLLRWIFAPRTA